MPCCADKNVTTTLYRLCWCGLDSTGLRLYMTNWTATSMPAHMFKCAAAGAPPPSGLAFPLLWGDEATVQERPDREFMGIMLSRKLYPQWRYPFDGHALVQLIREKYGPVKRACELATPEQAENVQNTLAEVYLNHSQPRNGVLTTTGLSTGGRSTRR